MAFERIPEELRNLNQWVIWKYEDIGRDKPSKIPYNALTKQKARVSNPEDFKSFEQCIKSCEGFNGIGFVLTRNDPYVIVDLDKSDDSEEWNFQKEIFDALDSYSELSPSGKGLHIVCKSESFEKLNKKRANVEVYAFDRYITFTGEVFKDAPIKTKTDTLVALGIELGRGRPSVDSVSEYPQIDSDLQVYNKAKAAENGEKFLNLWVGRFKEYYPSQSEADFALINILAYYTRNRQQIVRMFRDSALGKREKAKRNDYVNRMVSRSFDRQVPEIDLTSINEQLEKVVLEQARINSQKYINSIPIAKFAIKPDEIEVTDKAYKPKSSTVDNFNFDFPPGLVGEIAQYIYESSPRPVKEISLSGALGLMAGICGRSFNVFGTGLNIYLLFLATTGSGKDAVGTSLERLMGKVAKVVPASEGYIGPSEIASPQAAVKALSNNDNHSFVQIIDEFGILLGNMSGRYANPNAAGIKRFMLLSYTKSGQGRTFRPIVYSNSDKNTIEIPSPSYSILGESTPEKFFENIDEDVIAQGLAPRFTVIHYEGPRVPLNKMHRFNKPNEELVNKISTLAAQSTALNAQHKALPVELSKEAEQLFDEYNVYCDWKINNGNEVSKQLWNRAHLKAAKLAALITVGINWVQPIVSKEAALWAIRLTEFEIGKFYDKYESGEMNKSNAEESDQIKRIRQAIKLWHCSEFKSIERYCKSIKNAERFHYEKVIPYSFIHSKCASAGCFRNDKIGPTNAMRRTIELMKTNGDIIECDPIRMWDKFQTKGKCFNLVNETLLR